MHELRLNLLTNDWVVVTTEGSRRPLDEQPRTHPGSRPRRSPECPFCPGNEQQCAPALFEQGDPANWRVRVVPNKHPVLDPKHPPMYGGGEYFPRQAGFGYHEVVVESPRHDSSLAQMSVSEMAHVLFAYRERYRAMEEDKRIAHIVIFKNHGAEAGSWLEHPHTQVVGMPVVPPEVRSRLAISRRHHDERGECLACQLTQEELIDGDRVVVQNDSFAAFVPFAAHSPFHIWIFPLAHQASFGSLSDDHLDPLAMVLGGVLARVRGALADPDYNMIIRSAPRDARTSADFHWYISVVPRVMRNTGFELGTGMYINTLPPEVAAKRLRDAPDSAT